MKETESFEGTQASSIIEGLDTIYAEIQVAQTAWKEASSFPCPDGCGVCCVHFEPDVLESEALYLASWMISNQSARSDAILEHRFVSPRPDPENGCFLFDPASPFHCTVYGGRCLICRLFGHSGDHDKNGRPRWKPCKELGYDHQYNEPELLEKFGQTPPMMADITARVLALMPDRIQHRRPLREALPDAIAKIRMLQQFS